MSLGYPTRKQRAKSIRGDLSPVEIVKGVTVALCFYGAWYAPCFFLPDPWSYTWFFGFLFMLWGFGALGPAQARWGGPVPPWLRRLFKSMIG